MKKSMWLATCAAVAVAALPLGAWADSISPASYEDTLAVGESVTIQKTVTITAAAPTSAKLDVLFLFDTTGSMGGLINNAKTKAGEILTSLSGFGDVEFGVAHYEDFPFGGWGGSSDVPYGLVTAIGGNATAGINSLSLGWGADGLESDLYALQQAASQAATGWRDLSTRVIVWMGDIGGHEPSNTAGYPGPSTADTIAALNAQGIYVEAISVGAPGLDSEGQASAITGATYGSMYTMAASSTAIADEIKAQVGTAFATYGTVTLSTTAPAGVGVAWAPASYVGDYDRSVDRTFDFDVTFTGVTAGTYSFTVDALADGKLLASESDRIVVTDGTVPEPGTLVLLGTGLLGLAGFGRKRRS